ncbi:unnamed protein product [Ceutorhynchus assimilis]|uniref:Uncharacterized protein n=1 Tax=Ceutorhynchus assimilis TaxID=467358 RepID=A0A9N9MI96_9CUCU|nr:unnamed protein product [Ceutorhynchus assimilis]
MELQEHPNSDSDTVFADSELPSENLDPLDSALNELGMLATSTNSRKKYLAEIKTQNYLNNMLTTINTRYVSNVSIGFRVKPHAPSNRYRPYQTPLKERHRTRSENNDSEPSVAQKIIDSITASIAEMSQLKKAKSLESIVAEGGEDMDLGSIKFESHGELEQVSEAVQKLRVAE